MLLTLKMGAGGSRRASIGDALGQAAGMERERGRRGPRCGQGGDGMVPLLEHPRKEPLAGLAGSLPPERERSFQFSSTRLVSWAD